MSEFSFVFPRATLQPLVGYLHECGFHLRDLQATLNSEIKNKKVSVFWVFFKLGMSRLQATWITLDKRCGGTLRIYLEFFFRLENWSPFTPIVWEITATPF